MAGIRFSLPNLMRRLAVVLLATAPWATAAVILNNEQTALLQQQQQQPTNRMVSSTLFAELEESARLADIAYCVGTTGVHNPFGCLSHCEEFKGFELITTWNTGPLLSDSCGYIALSHSPSAKRIIVAFRGTYSLANTIVDLSAVPQTYVPYPADGDDDTNNNALKTAKCNNCTVHAGFWTSWKNSRETVLTAVTQAREQYPDYEVTLIGHSLGGAVAALAGLEMYSRGYDPQVTTFGEPRVGNDEMAEFINAIFDHSPLPDGGGTVDDGMLMRYRRVTHVNDPVPLLPLTEWGYSAHAGEIYISKLDLPPSRGELKICTGNADKHCIAGAEDDGKDEEESYEAGISPLLALVTQQLLQFQASEEELKTQWSLVPARYRMWELFFAHRDYFWRIGLCVPGGDPSSWRW